MIRKRVNYMPDWCCPRDIRNVLSKGRTPITADQIKLIAWWIDQGANFDKKVHEIPQTEEIAHLLKKLETGEKESCCIVC
jgi:hypothetical protein